MHILSETIVKHRLFAIAAIGGFLFAGSVSAEPPPVVKSPDVASPEKPSEKVAEKPAAQPKRITQSSDGSVTLSARSATVHGSKLRYERDKGTLGYWFNADDWVSWEFEITQPAKLFVDLTESCGPDSGGSHYTVEVGDQKLKDKVQETGSFRVFRLRRIGTLEFEKPGIYTLSVRVLDKPQTAVMDLRAIKLSPPKSDKPAWTPPSDKKPAAKPATSGPAAVPSANKPSELEKPVEIVPTPK